MAEGVDWEGSASTAPTTSRQSTPSRGLGHVTALDGLRAVAVLLVMGYHASLPGFHGGSVGVDIFFVLSGFLITALLLDELRQTGGIQLGAFYMRRILRLYPALVVGVALALSLAALKILLFSASSTSLDATVEGVPFTMLYTVNIARAVHWTGGGFLGHAWSLAIEEQFYLFWPLVVIVVMRRRPRAGLLGLIALGCALTSAALRAGLDAAGVDSGLLFNATFSHVDGIFAGCALGVAWSVRHRIVKWMSNPIASLGAVLAVALVVVRAQSMNTYGILVAVVGTALVVASLLVRARSAMSKLLSNRPLVEIGRRSYGLYLFHWPIFRFVGIDARPLPLLLGFGLSFAAAWLSFALVERPFLRMKRRWARRPGPGAAESPSAAPSGC